MDADSRKNEYLNMLAVWSLTGFWHGASWEFILWGLWYFVMLVLDKYLLERLKAPGFLRRLTMFLSVGIGWMMFSANGAENILPMLQSLVTIRSEGHSLFWLREMAPVLCAAVLCCVPALANGAKKLVKPFTWLRFAVMLALLLLSLAALTKSSYNPFLYFRF